MNTKLNKSDWVLIALVYIVTTAINSLNYYRQGNNLIEYLIDFPLEIFLSIIVIIIFMYWLIPQYIVKNKQYFVFIVLGCVILSITGIIDYSVGFWTAGNDWNKFPGIFDLIVKSFFETADEVGFVFGILVAKKFYEGQTQYIKIEKQQKENELKLLRSQLDPHFLFNNLNTLDALIDKNPTKAKEYINRLSLIYRYLIKTKDVEIMELSEELILAENYIFLIKTRFGKDYEFKVDVKNVINDVFIPTGAIQALLENVVKHNKVQNKNTIKTTILIKDNWLTVCNIKSKIASSQESFGTGLGNLKTRYKLISDKKISITDNELEFKVKIPLIKLMV